MMPLHNNKSTTENGFTLIELVVVIIILGIIAIIALPKFIDLGQNAKIATVKNHGRNIFFSNNLGPYKVGRHGVFRPRR
jgi:MSHA pilin protein MshB